MNTQTKALIGLFLATSLISFIYIYKVGTTLDKIGFVNEKKTIQKQLAYDDVNLEAQSVYVYDATDKEVLFALHEESLRPIASITKIMTALIAYKNLSAHEVIIPTENNMPYIEDAKPPSGSTWYPKELISFMLVGSSNNAALVLGQEVERRISGQTSDLKNTLEEMNQKARKIGLERTTFNSVTGLDDAGSPQATSTVKETATLAYFAYKSHPELFVPTESASDNFIGTKGEKYTVVNTNSIINSIPHVKLSKTGFTETAGGNLVVVYKSSVNQHDIVSVVLGSTREGRFNDILQLIKATDNYFSNN